MKAHYKASFSFCCCYLLLYHLLAWRPLNIILHARGCIISFSWENTYYFYVHFHQPFECVLLFNRRFLALAICEFDFSSSIYFFAVRVRFVATPTTLALFRHSKFLFTSYHRRKPNIVLLSVLAVLPIKRRAISCCFAHQLIIIFCYHRLSKLALSKMSWI